MSNRKTKASASIIAWAAGYKGLLGEPTRFSAGLFDSDIMPQYNIRRETFPLSLI